jgi:hypothetical protein
MAGAGYRVSRINEPESGSDRSREWVREKGRKREREIGMQESL